MYGREFCGKVNEYLSAFGEETQGVGVIQWYVPAFFPHEMSVSNFFLIALGKGDNENQTHVCCEKRAVVHWTISLDFVDVKPPKWR